MCDYFEFWPEVLAAVTRRYFHLRRFSKSRSISGSTPSVRLSVRTHEWTLVGNFKFPKFLYFYIFMGVELDIFSIRNA